MKFFNLFACSSKQSSSFPSPEVKLTAGAEADLETAVTDLDRKAIENYCADSKNSKKVQSLLLQAHPTHNILMVAARIWFNCQDDAEKTKNAKSNFEYLLTFIKDPKVKKTVLKNLSDEFNSSPKAHPQQTAEKTFFNKKLKPMIITHFDKFQVKPKKKDKGVDSKPVSNFFVFPPLPQTQVFSFQLAMNNYICAR